MSFFKKVWKSNSKHQKLSEEWALANSLRAGSNDVTQLAADGENTETESDVTFLVKYLGSTLIDSPRSGQATAEAVTSIINMAKASGKKLQRVALSVSLRGIEMSNATTGEQLLEVSIYRISYCSADAAHDHVFAFIATNDNETMECHAFLCPKRKMAQAVTLTVAQNFTTAFQVRKENVWQSQEENRLMEPGCIKNKMEMPTMDHLLHKPETPSAVLGSSRSLLIDFNSDLPPKRCGNEDAFAHNTWVSFEDDQLEVDNNAHNLWNDSDRICS